MLKIYSIILSFVCLGVIFTYYSCGEDSITDSQVNDTINNITTQSITINFSPQTTTENSIKITTTTNTLQTTTTYNQVNYPCNWMNYNFYWPTLTGTHSLGDMMDKHCTMTLECDNLKGCSVETKDENFGNFSFELGYNHISGGQDSPIRFGFRWKNFASGIAMYQLLLWDDGHWGLLEYKGGGVNYINEDMDKTVINAPFNTGYDVTNRIKVEARQDAISIYINDVLEEVINNPSIASGNFLINIPGKNSFSTSIQKYQFTNIYFTEY